MSTAPIAVHRTSPRSPCEAVPAELRGIPQWVVWRYLTRKGKRTKVPFRAALPDAEASSTDRSTWASFEEAQAAYLQPANKLDGIGFVFAPDDGLAGVDFDNCLDGRGEVLGWARPELDAIEGYAEVSPSGRGVKVFTRGSVPDGRGRKLQKLGDDQTGVIEVYDRGRYFTMTGNVFETRTDLGDGANALARCHARWFPPKGPRPRSTSAVPVALGDSELIAKARGARNGAKFSALFDGSTEGHPSKSEADLALCSLLAYWFGGDIDSIDRLFRQSGLCDAKWAERPDYRDRTIAKALEGKTEFYDPNYRSASEPARSLKVVRDDDPEADPPDVPPVAAEADKPPRPNESDEDPHRLARIYRDTECHHPDGPTLVYYRSEFHRWDGAYRPVLEKDVRADLANSAKVEFDRINVKAVALHDGKGKIPKTSRVTTGLINNVTLALSGYTLLPGQVDSPAWLGIPGPWPASEILPASNGLLHLPTFAAGKPALIPPTTRFFCSYSIGYDFDALAPPPATWLDFLAKLWPHDPESIRMLQEWYGYHLTPDVSHQKIGTIIGPKRSGKGTIARVLTAMIGHPNVCNPTLSGLGTQFGSAVLIGKLAAIITDARISGRSDIAQIVENLLSISGEDGKTISRKHLPDWTGKLMAKFTIFSNESPRLADSSGALAGRMMILKLTRSFYGQEDRRLFEKLVPELPGILLWAIQGWQRLNERGYFVQPESGRPLVEEMEELSSPIGTFVRDCCTVEHGRQVEVDTLFLAWKEWCQRMNREQVGDQPAFGRNLRTVLPTLETKPVKRGGKYHRVFEGIDLNPPTF